MKALTLAEWRERGEKPEPGTPILCANPECGNTFPYREDGAPANRATCDQRCKRRRDTLRKRGVKITDELVLDYLTKGRTMGEMVRRFRLPEEKVRELLVPVREGYELFQTRNNQMERVWVYIPIPREEIVVKPREYKYALQPDGQPYIWVQFPDTWDFKKIKIIPYSDLHKGAWTHKRELHLEYVNWIARTPNVFWFINGDFMELSYGDSNRGVSVYEQTARPRTQREELAMELAPIAHKCLWAQPGNHERRSARYDIDPLEWVCDKLDIPYFREPVYADVMWKGYVWSFFAQHGATNATTEGGKLNAAMRPLKWQEFTHFTIMGHVHDSTTKRKQRMCRDRINFRLEERKCYVVICPGFLEYLGSYAALAGLEPGDLGNVTCEIYPNGDYHATS